MVRPKAGGAVKEVIKWFIVFLLATIRIFWLIAKRFNHFVFKKSKLLATQLTSYIAIAIASYVAINE